VKKKERRFVWKENLLAASATVVILLVVFSLAIILVVGPFFGPVISSVFIGAALGLAIGMLFGPFVPNALRRLRPPDKRKPIRAWHRVMGVVVIALVTMTGLVGAAYIQEQYKLEKARRFYEVGVSFSAEGQDFEHTAIVEIRPTKIAFTTFSMSREVHTVQMTNWMGKLLPSGAAVLFRMPDRLGTLAQAQSKAGASNIRFLPVAYWLDDADDPSTIESYVSEAYYEQPSPRLRIHSFSVRKIADGTATDPRVNIGWLAESDDVGHQEGIYAEVVPKSQWEDIPEVAKMLHGVTEPHVFSGEDSGKISESIPVSCPFGRIGAFGVPLGDSVFSHVYGEDKCRTASRRFHPFRRLNGRFELALDDPGAQVNYPDFTVPWNVDVWIADRSFPASKIDRWLFDPVTHLLLRIRKSYVQPASSTFERFFE